MGSCEPEIGLSIPPLSLTPQRGYTHDKMPEGLSSLLKIFFFLMAQTNKCPLPVFTLLFKAFKIG